MYNNSIESICKKSPSKLIPEGMLINKWSLYYSLYYRYHRYSIEVKLERLGNLISDKISNEFIRSWIST